MIRCVFLSLVLGSTICASDRALPENDPGELGVIEGEVFDSAGSPLASACVWVRERGRPQSGVLHSVFTDEAGHFRIEKLRLGVHEVFVSPEREPSFLSKLAKVVRLTGKRPEQHITISMGVVHSRKPPISQNLRSNITFNASMFVQ